MKTHYIGEFLYEYSPAEAAALELDKLYLKDFVAIVLQPASDKEAQVKLLCTYSSCSTYLRMAHNTYVLVMYSYLTALHEVYMDFYSRDPRTHSLIMSSYAAIYAVATEWVHTIRNLLAILVTEQLCMFYLWTLFIV